MKKQKLYPDWPLVVAMVVVLLISATSALFDLAAQNTKALLIIIMAFVTIETMLISTLSNQHRVRRMLRP